MSSYPEWSEAEWLDFFAQWVEHHQAKTDMRVAELLAESNALHRERAALPPAQHAAIDARLKAIAAEMADTVAPRPPPPTAATWVDSHRRDFET